MRGEGNYSGVSRCGFWWYRWGRGELVVGGFPVGEEAIVVRKREDRGEVHPVKVKREGEEKEGGRQFFFRGERGKGGVNG
ncbi:hypothetical protein HAX54_046471, partial [Datura stramonium]|nr:hypothetical protein [Datura stramonium]